MTTITITDKMSCSYKLYGKLRFFSPPVQLARWAHMHHFASVCGVTGHFLTLPYSHSHVLPFSHPRGPFSHPAKSEKMTMVG